MPVVSTPSDAHEVEARQVAQSFGAAPNVAAGSMPAIASGSVTHPIVQRQPVQADLAAPRTAVGKSSFDTLYGQLWYEESNATTILPLFEAANNSTSYAEERFGVMREHEGKFGPTRKGIEELSASSAAP